MRNLKAIEIAEGALLADIAIIFQFIAAFLPAGTSLLYTLIFIIFTILVLRRGLYVGIMGMCVALFVIAILIGPQRSVLMLLEGLGGIFLGTTMKQRWYHLPIILVGSLAGAFTLCALLLLFSLLLGIPFNSLVVALHQAYNAFIAGITPVMTRLGMATIWKLHIYPSINSLVTYLFRYWLLLFYAVMLIALCPVVCVIYTVTNAFVRLLGYDVRPFPGGWLGKWLHSLKRRLLKLSVKWGIARKLWKRA